MTEVYPKPENDPLCGIRFKYPPFSAEVYAPEKKQSDTVCEEHPRTDLEKGFRNIEWPH